MGTISTPVWHRPLCPECQIYGGHSAGCPRTPVAVPRGLRLRVMVDDDVMGYRRVCPHCELGFEHDRYVVEPPNQSFSLHLSCVVALAAAYATAISPQQDADEEIDRRYEAAARELDALHE